MDLLGENPAFDVSDPTWKIHSRNPLAPPEYLGEKASVKNSMIALGCEIYGQVENSVLSSNTVIEEGAVVKDSVIMSGTVVKSGANIQYSIIDESVTIGRNATVGAEKATAKGITVLGRGISVGAGAHIPDSAIIDKNVEGKED